MNKDNVSHVQNLFDLQHFNMNTELQELIDETLTRCGSRRVQLSDSDIENLNAAGSATSTLRPEQEI